MPDRSSSSKARNLQFGWIPPGVQILQSLMLLQDDHRAGRIQSRQGASKQISDVDAAGSAPERHWIPAFAGMTMLIPLSSTGISAFAGMTMLIPLSSTGISAFAGMTMLIPLSSTGIPAFAGMTMLIPLSATGLSALAGMTMLIPLGSTGDPRHS